MNRNNRRDVFVVGLTGGIGCGKTAVSDAFERLGVPVIDTDRISRELVEPGQAALTEIANFFGRECITDDGTLDRKWLRERIFSDASARTVLERILHPRIRHQVSARLGKLSTPYCVVVVPLLVESGMTEITDRVLVVDAPLRLQVERIMARDSVDEAHARRIVAAQADREQRLAIADDVIDNRGSVEQLEQAVATMHRKYQRQAESMRR